MPWLEIDVKRMEVRCKCCQIAGAENNYAKGVSMNNALLCNLKRHGDSDEHRLHAGGSVERKAPRIDEFKRVLEMRRHLGFRNI